MRSVAIVEGTYLSSISPHRIKTKTDKKTKHGSLQEFPEGANLGSERETAKSRKGGQRIPLTVACR